MFGFLIKGEVNDEAVRLKAIADLAARKYCFLKFEQACAAIAIDFAERQRFIQHKVCGFQYPELLDFQFHLDGALDPSPIPLSIFGHGKYAGFLLQSSDGGARWHASVEDGISYRATGGAKMLLKILEKRFGVRDLAKFLARFQ